MVLAWINCIPYDLFGALPFNFWNKKIFDLQIKSEQENVKSFYLRLKV